MLSEKLASLEISTHLWGINATSIVCYTIDAATSSHYLVATAKLETIRVNCAISQDQFSAGCAFLADTLGMTKNGSVTPFGRFLLSLEDPSNHIAIRVITSFPAIQRFANLVNARQIDSLPFSEFCAFFPDESLLFAKLLASFGLAAIARIHSEIIVKPNRSLLEEFGRRVMLDRETANWVLTKQIVSSLLNQLDAKYIDRICGSFLEQIGLHYSPVDGKSPLELLRFTEYPLGEMCSKILSSSDILLDLLTKERNQASKEARETLNHFFPIFDKLHDITELQISPDILRKASASLGIPEETLRPQLSETCALSNLYGSVLSSYLCVKFSCSLDMLARVLDDFFPRMSIVGPLFTVIQPKFFPELNRSSWSDYASFVFHSFKRLENRVEVLDKLIEGWNQSKDTAFIIERIVAEIKETLLNELSNTPVAPHNFAFTLLNPTDIGDDARLKYSSTNPVLLNELDKLSNNWPHIQTDNCIRYSEALDKLLAKGIEGEISTPELRIMTPYTDYELKNYVAMIRELIDRGFKVKILSRLARKREPWVTFQESFTKGLGTKSQQVECRTYTRFKTFQKKSQLQSKKNISQEFGVHAKLFIIGGTDGGAVLLGSANLLDNSFRWNPECGVYSEDRKFIESARLFFDFVWELSKTDTLQMWKMEKIPKGPFFPSVYH